MIRGGDHYCSFTGEVKGNKLRIGNTEVDLYNPENRTKVPDVLFYENTQVKRRKITMRASRKFFSGGDQLQTRGGPTNFTIAKTYILEN